MPRDLPQSSLTAAYNTASALPFTGSGLQFDVGFKQQTVTDYQAGGLSFVRTYRSDSTWTNNTLGKFWRHNYARTLTVVPGTSASITECRGHTPNSNLFYLYAASFSCADV